LDRFHQMTRLPCVFVSAGRGTATTPILRTVSRCTPCCVIRKLLMAIALAWLPKNDFPSGDVGRRRCPQRAGVRRSIEISASS
jgi:hypothetical protein